MGTMAINNVIAVGDDQKWKSEVERAIEDLAKQVAILIKNTAGR